MFRSTGKSILVACAALGALLALTPAFAHDKTTTTQAELTGTYTGALVDPDPVFPREFTHHLTVKLDRLTPKAEFERMMVILAERGQDALEQELWNEEVGTVQIDNSLAHPIVAAFRIDGKNGFGHLILVIDRPISIGEIFSASRSTDYPFSVIEFDVEKDGVFSGEMMVAAQMEFDDGTLEIENLAFQPLRILSVDHEKAS